MVKEYVGNYTYIFKGRKMFELRVETNLHCKGCDLDFCDAGAVEILFGVEYPCLMCGQPLAGGEYPAMLRRVVALQHPKSVTAELLWRGASVETRTLPSGRTVPVYCCPAKVAGGAF